MTTAIWFVSWIVFIGVFAVLAYRVDRLCSEVDKLNEYLRRPVGVQASEVRITPTVAYNVIEGGKKPESAAEWMVRDQQMRNALRFTRR